MPPAISNIWLVGVTALRWGGDESKRVVGGLNGAGINGRLDSLVERYGVSTCSSTTSDSTVTKTLNGVIHGRTIELADDPGLNEGERVLVELRSREPERTNSNAGRLKGVPAAAVRGLCSPQGVAPPDDAECQQILEDELIRKNSP